MIKIVSDLRKVSGFPLVLLCSFICPSEFRTIFSLVNVEWPLHIFLPKTLWYSNLVISFSPSVNVGWHYHWQVWLPPHRNEHLVYFFRWVKFFFQVIGHFLLYIYYTMHQNVDNKTNYIKKESFLSSAWEFVDIFNGQWLFWSRSNQWFYVQYVEYLSWSRINYDENCYEQTKCFLVNILHMFQITRVQCM